MLLMFVIMKALSKTTRQFTAFFVLTFFAIAGLGIAQAEELNSGSWQKKSYSAAGSWKIESEGEQKFLVINNLKTKSGPNLTLFLSPLSASKAKGSNATQGSLKLSLLPSHRGSHKIALPKGTNLSRYQSVLIHCEKFSKLWSAGQL